MVFANNVGTNTDGRAFETDGETVSETAWIRGNVFSGLVNNLDPGSGAYVPGGGEGDYSSPDDWDFYPDANSVLLGAGDTSGEAYIPSEDFNGAPRDGANPTVGAYEWSTADNPGWVVSEGFKTPGFTGAGGEEVGGCCIRDANAPEAGLWGVPLLLLWSARRRREDRSSVNDA